MTGVQPLAISAYTLTTAAGAGRAAVGAALAESRCPLTRRERWALPMPVGEVEGIDAVSLLPAMRHFDCRNHRLAELALARDGFTEAVARARARYGAARIGVFAGTSTSGILETERAFRGLGEDEALPIGHPYATTHRLSALATFVSERLELAGPAISISTACSSSARAFAAASRHMRLGLCDAAVVAGVDSLCMTTLRGFTSLQLTADTPCRPFAADRAGLSIGEAAGFALLEREAAGAVRLYGYGESADAHHMSTPHPQAVGARLAMRRALASAGLSPDAVDYVNLHGTATRTNDAVEDVAVTAELGEVPASSTKGWTGHTLGAAGVVEALITAFAIERGWAPGTLNTAARDPAMALNLLTEGQEIPIRRALSNSFGFGGNNCTLVLGPEE